MNDDEGTTRITFTAPPEIKRRIEQYEDYIRTTGLMPISRARAVCDLVSKGSRAHQEELKVLKRARVQK